MYLKYYIIWKNYTKFIVDIVIKHKVIFASNIKKKTLSEPNLKEHAASGT